MAAANRRRNPPRNTDEGDASLSQRGHDLSGHVQAVSDSAPILGRKRSDRAYRSLLRSRHISRPSDIYQIALGSRERS
jgi:hypothetical protein